MRAILLIDFGSTYTKLTAVDLEGQAILGNAQAFTTAATDISLGLQEAEGLLQGRIGKPDYIARLACSSAAGGLNMVACGLVPGLTSKAARMAAFGAGAKVIKTFAYQLTDADVNEIERIQPDILLLSGGIDGGNQEVIVYNAGRLAQAKGDFPIVIAGNRSAQDECAAIISKGSHRVYRSENVMPEMNSLNIEPVAGIIREIFLERIVLAKGLGKANAYLDGILMPTPSAVQSALTLLSKGSGGKPGLGELLAVDLGGATTDIYSIAKGDPVNPTTVLRGLPEPLVKRTVEGDLGMRYNAQGILEAVGAGLLSGWSGLDGDRVTSRVHDYHANPSILPECEEDARLDEALAAAAVSVALARHAGSLEKVYTPVGPVYQQTGKDLTEVSRMIVTGGALLYARHLEEILKNALAAPDIMALTPRKARVTADRQYILSAMGLLAGYEPEAALNMMMEVFGREGAYAAV